MSLFNAIRSTPATRGMLLFALMSVAGCSQVNAIKSKVSDTFGSNTAPTNASTDASADGAQAMSLSAITNTYLQHGRYAEGEQQLRQYLAKYPNDRAAQNLLRQLTGDPKSMLGANSRSYVVQAGDSYSTLAARTLGDSNQFLVLARYNGSTNPAALRTGDTVRLPTRGTVSNGSAATKGSTTPVPTVIVTPNLTESAAPVDESPTAKAQRLQAESNALLKQGQNSQALSRLDEALTVDPHLKPAGNQALRTQLLGSYHERAVVLYRDQKLDQAIALWDHVLAIDPGYERAVIYRARAVELQHRLNQI
jgi:tetratricopeptide (TPR) repeat protein